MFKLSLSLAQLSPSLSSLLLIKTKQTLKLSQIGLAAAEIWLSFKYNEVLVVVVVMVFNDLSDQSVDLSLHCDNLLLITRHVCGYAMP